MAKCINITKRTATFGDKQSEIVTSLVNSGIIGSEAAVNVFKTTLGSEFLKAVNDGEMYLKEPSVQSRVNDNEVEFFVEGKNGKPFVIHSVVASRDSVQNAVAEMYVEGRLKLDLSTPEIRPAGGTALLEGANLLASYYDIVNVNDNYVTPFLKDNVITIEENEVTLDGLTYDEVKNEKIPFNVVKETLVDGIVQKIERILIPPPDTKTEQLADDLILTAAKMGITIHQVHKIASDNGYSLKGVANFFDKVIQVVDSRDTSVMSEEIAHFIVEDSYSKRDKAVDEALDLITEEKFPEEFKTYRKVYGNNEVRIKLEILGKLAGKSLELKLKYDRNSLLGKIKQIFLNFIDRFKSNGRLRSIARDIINSNTFSSTEFRPIHRQMFSVDTSSNRASVKVVLSILETMTSSSGTGISFDRNIDSKTLSKLNRMSKGLTNDISSWDELLGMLTDMLLDFTLPYKALLPEGSASGVAALRTSEGVNSTLQITDTLRSIQESVKELHKIESNLIRTGKQANKVSSDLAYLSVVLSKLINISTATEEEYQSIIEEELEQSSLSEEDKDEVREGVNNEVRTINSFKKNFWSLLESPVRQLSTFGHIFRRARLRANRESNKVIKDFTQLLRKKKWNYAKFAKLIEKVGKKKSIYLIAPYRNALYNKDFKAYVVSIHNRIHDTNYSSFEELKNDRKKGKTPKLADYTNKELELYNALTKQFVKERTVIKINNRIKEEAYSRLSDKAKLIVDEHSRRAGHILDSSKKEVYDSRNLTIQQKIALQVNKVSRMRAVSKWKGSRRKTGEELALAEELQEYYDTVAKSYNSPSIKEGILDLIEYRHHYGIINDMQGTEAEIRMIQKKIIPMANYLAKMTGITFEEAFNKLRRNTTTETIEAMANEYYDLLPAGKKPKRINFLKSARLFMTENSDNNVFGELPSHGSSHSSNVKYSGQNGSTAVDNVFSSLFDSIVSLLELSDQEASDFDNSLKNVTLYNVNSLLARAHGTKVYLYSEGEITDPVIIRLLYMKAMLSMVVPARAISGTNGRVNLQGIDGMIMNTFELDIETILRLNISHSSHNYKIPDANYKTKAYYQELTTESLEFLLSNGTFIRGYTDEDLHATILKLASDTNLMTDEEAKLISEYFILKDRLSDIKKAYRNSSTLVINGSAMPTSVKEEFKDLTISINNIYGKISSILNFAKSHEKLPPKIKQQILDSGATVNKDILKVDPTSIGRISSLIEIIIKLESISELDYSNHALRGDSVRTVLEVFGLDTQSLSQVDDIVGLKASSVNIKALIKGLKTELEVQQKKSKKHIEPNEHYFNDVIGKGELKFIEQNITNSASGKIKKAKVNNQVFHSILVELGVISFDESVTPHLSFKEHFLIEYGRTKLLGYYSNSSYGEVADILNNHVNLDIEEILKGNDDKIKFNAPAQWLSEDPNYVNPDFLGLDYRQLTDEYLNTEFFESMGIDIEAFKETGELVHVQDATQRQIDNFEVWSKMIELKRIALENTDSNPQELFLLPQKRKTLVDRIFNFNVGQLVGMFTDIGKVKDDKSYGVENAPVRFYLKPLSLEYDVSSDLESSYSSMVAKSFMYKQIIKIEGIVKILHDNLVQSINKAGRTIKGDNVHEMFMENVSYLLYSKDFAGKESLIRTLSFRLSSLIVKSMVAFSSIIGATVLATSHIFRAKEALMATPTDALAYIKSVFAGLSPKKMHDNIIDFQSKEFSSKAHKLGLAIGVILAEEQTKNAAFTRLGRLIDNLSTAFFEVAEALTDPTTLRTATSSVKIIGDKAYTKRSAVENSLGSEYTKAKTLAYYINRSIMPEGWTTEMYEQALNLAANVYYEIVKRTDGKIEHEEQPLAKRDPVLNLTLGLRSWFLVALRQSFHHNKPALGIDFRRVQIFNNNKENQTDYIRAANNTMVSALFLVLSGIVAGMVKDYDDQESDFGTSNIELFALYLAYRIADEVSTNSGIGTGIAFIDILNNLSVVISNLNQGKLPNIFKSYDKGMLTDSKNNFIRRSKLLYTLLNVFSETKSEVNLIMIQEHDADIKNAMNLLHLKKGIDVTEMTAEIRELRKRETIFKNQIKKGLDFKDLTGTEYINRLLVLKGLGIYTEKSTINEAEIYKGVRKQVGIGMEYLNGKKQDLLDKYVDKNYHEHYDIYNIIKVIKITNQKENRTDEIISKFIKVK